MAAIDSGSVELVVTSPPYPMIEMWDEVFTELNPEIRTAFAEGEGWQAFELMHTELEKTWSELSRVVSDGGIVCINVGDATRTVDGSFRVYQNHSRIIDDMEKQGFEPLPEILWRKPVNSAAKFMGSGMLPPNAYPTLEHEYILVFRKGSQSRDFEPGEERRYASAYFWEERNEWFSDIWMDIRGTRQELDGDDLRERSAAYPLEIPYRLIHMYSVYGDTVLDPFWGTGTTSLAAMVAGRNSVGYEIEAEFPTYFDDRVPDLPRHSQALVSDRIQRHREFVSSRRDEGAELNYQAENYDFPVMTKQEKRIQFYTVEAVSQEEATYTVSYEPVSTTGTAEYDSTHEQTSLNGTFE